MPCNERLDGCRKCARIQRSHNLDNARQIVGCISRIKFVEKPKPPLSEREAKQILSDIFRPWCQKTIALLARVPRLQEIRTSVNDNKAGWIIVLRSFPYI